MVEYRTGSHWGRTIIRVGIQPADATGKRPDDQLVGTMDDPELAERICALLNAEAEVDARPTCTKCGNPLDGCVDCGKPTQCGEPWCTRHSPDGDWGRTSISHEDA